MDALHEINWWLTIIIGGGRSQETQHTQLNAQKKVAMSHLCAECNGIRPPPVGLPIDEIETTAMTSTAHLSSAHPERTHRTIDASTPLDLGRGENSVGRDGLAAAAVTATGQCFHNEFPDARKPPHR